MTEDDLLHALMDEKRPEQTNPHRRKADESGRDGYGYESSLFGKEEVLILDYGYGCRALKLHQQPLPS